MGHNQKIQKTLNTDYFNLMKGFFLAWDFSISIFKIFPIFPGFFKYFYAFFKIFTVVQNFNGFYKTSTCFLQNLFKICNGFFFIFLVKFFVKFFVIQWCSASVMLSFKNAQLHKRSA